MTWFTKHLNPDSNAAIDALPGLKRFKELMAGFGDYLLAERNFSLRTKISYRSDLLQLLEYLSKTGRDCSPDDFNTETARAFLVWCREVKGHSEASRARRASAIRHFYGYLLDNGHIKTNPISNLKSGKIPKRLPRPLAETEMIRLLNAPDAGTFSGIRDRAAMEFLYGSGLRISELCSMTFGSLDLQLTGAGQRQQRPAGPFVAGFVAGFGRISQAAGTKEQGQGSQGCHLPGRPR